MVTAVWRIWFNESNASDKIQCEHFCTAMQRNVLDSFIFVRVCFFGKSNDKVLAAYILNNVTTYTIFNICFNRYVIPQERTLIGFNHISFDVW